MSSKRDRNTGIIIKERKIIMKTSIKCVLTAAITCVLATGILVTADITQQIERRVLKPGETWGYRSGDSEKNKKMTQQDIYDEMFAGSPYYHGDPTFPDYVEPVPTAGKYYLKGDINGPYYEITEDGYYQLFNFGDEEDYVLWATNGNGMPIDPKTGEKVPLMEVHLNTIDFLKSRHQFISVTDHYRGDYQYLFSTDWITPTPNDPYFVPYNGQGIRYYDQAKVVEIGAPGEWQFFLID